MTFFQLTQIVWTADKKKTKKEKSENLNIQDELCNICK